jgi:hypothetical protein
MIGRARMEKVKHPGVTPADLTCVLAERVMGWRVAPDRFLLGNRRWKPRWRFEPNSNLEHAFELLEAANTAEYTMGRSGGEPFSVRVRLRTGAVGEAQDDSKPRAITLAIASAFGIKSGRFQ